MKDALRLRESFKAGTKNDPRDVTKITEALRVTGFLPRPAGGGPAGAAPSEAAVGGALRSFQDREGLVVDGLARPGGQTERHLAHMVEREAERAARPPRTGPIRFGTLTADNYRESHGMARGVVRRNDHRSAVAFLRQVFEDDPGGALPEAMQLADRVEDLDRKQGARFRADLVKMLRDVQPTFAPIIASGRIPAGGSTHVGATLLSPAAVLRPPTEDKARPTRDRDSLVPVAMRTPDDSPPPEVRALEAERNRILDDILNVTPETYDRVKGELDGTNAFSNTLHKPDLKQALEAFRWNDDEAARRHMMEPFEKYRRFDPGRDAAEAFFEALAPSLLGRRGTRRPGQRPGTIAPRRVQPQRDVPLSLPGPAATRAYQADFNKWWRAKGTWLFEDRKINRGNVAPEQSFIWNRLRNYDGPTKTNGHTGDDKLFFQWDPKHGEIEVYNKGGWPIGAIDALTGEWLKRYNPKKTKRKRIRVGIDDGDGGALV